MKKIALIVLPALVSAGLHAEFPTELDLSTATERSFAELPPLSPEEFAYRTVKTFELNPPRTREETRLLEDARETVKWYQQKRRGSSDSNVSSLSPARSRRSSSGDITPTIARFLPRRGSDISLAEIRVKLFALGDKSVPTGWLAKRKHLNNIRALLRTYPSLFAAKDSNGQTFLHRVVLACNAVVVKLLVTEFLATERPLSGFDPNARDNEERTPLYFAIATGNTPIVKLLLAAHTIDIYRLDEHNTPALHCVASQLQDPGKRAALLEIAELLFQKGARMRQKVDRQTPRDIVASFRDTELLKEWDNRFAGRYVDSPELDTGE